MQNRKIAQKRKINQNISEYFWKANKRAKNQQTNQQGYKKNMVFTYLENMYTDCRIIHG